MTAPEYLFAIGSAWNMSLGDLTNVQNIVDSNGRHLYPPQSYGSYLPGQPATRGNGVPYFRGYESMRWKWTGNPGGFVLYDGALTLRNEIFNGEWGGTCTIYSNSYELPDDYKLYNAVAEITLLPDSGANFKALTAFGIKYTRLVEREE